MVWSIKSGIVGLCWCEPSRCCQQQTDKWEVSSHRLQERTYTDRDAVANILICVLPCNPLQKNILGKTPFKHHSKYEIWFFSSLVLRTAILCNFCLFILAYMLLAVHFVVLLSAEHVSLWNLRTSTSWIWSESFSTVYQFLSPVKCYIYADFKHSSCLFEIKLVNYSSWILKRNTCLVGSS